MPAPTYNCVSQSLSRLTRAGEVRFDACLFLVGKIHTVRAFKQMVHDAEKVVKSFPCRPLLD